MYHGHEELQYVWEPRFQHQYGCLRDEVTKTLKEYLNCGILAHGAARVYCDGCKHSLLIAFSCKRRGVCPSCGAKRAVKFAEHIHSEVIEDVPHRHTVFTIPKRLLFRAAWGALKDILGVDERELGAIFTVQTAGEALNQPRPGAASWQSQVQGWRYRTLTFTDSWQTATGKTEYLPRSPR